MNTCDKSLHSCVDSAEDPKTGFPIQNLPYGSFVRDNRDEPRLCVAIGDQVLDVKAAAEGGYLGGLSEPAKNALMSGTLNLFAAMGAAPRMNLRRSLQTLLGLDGPMRNSQGAKRLLIPQSEVDMRMPFAIGDYTDFYASLHHATNVGKMFRPDNPLLPNWKYLPVGYHGRASSIVVSGKSIRRPMGQITKADEGPPMFASSAQLDYEVELGAFVATGNELGSRIPVSRAWDSLFGLVLMNDWSARDIQKWEYQPLGPFNAKNFATSISPWVVTVEAIAPFMLPGPPRTKDDPATIDYLKSGDDVVIDVTLEVWLATQSMREKRADPVLVCKGSSADLYWTFAQMVAHHTSTGCNLRTGDLLGSGTISGRSPESRGCLLERTMRGTEPLKMPDGTERAFLADGDEVIIRGECSKQGFRRISLGECRGTVTAAVA